MKGWQRNYSQSELLQLVRQDAEQSMPDGFCLDEIKVNFPSVLELDMGDGEITASVTIKPI